MGNPNLSDELKRDAVGQVTESGYPVIGNLLRRAKAFGFSLQKLPPESETAVS